MPLAFKDYFAPDSPVTLASTAPQLQNMGVLPYVGSVPSDASDELLRFAYDHREFVDAIVAFKDTERIDLVRRIWTHDANEAWGSLQMHLAVLNKRPGDIYNPEYASSISALAQTLGTVTSAMAYIGTDGQWPVPTIHPATAGYMIRENLSGSRRDHVTINTIEDSLAADEYLCLQQLAKNSRGQAEVTVRASKEDVVLIVGDNGTGILDKDGAPMPREKIPDIFGEYSTTGGGLGLQIVKRIADLRKGYVTVDTQAGEQASYYDTREKHAIPVPSGRPGTVFAVYLPR
jgi:hypothetical protein